MLHNYILQQMDLIQDLESNERFINLEMWLNMNIRGIFKNNDEEEQYLVWKQQLIAAKNKLLNIINETEGIVIRKRNKNGV